MVNGSGRPPKTYTQRSIDANKTLLEISSNSITIVPANLNIERLLMQNAFYSSNGKPNMQQVIEWLYFFVGYIYVRSNQKDKPIPIPAEKLKEINYNYSDYLSWLRQVGIVVIEEYSKGKKYRKYSISHEFTGAREYIIFNPKIIQKVPVTTRNEYDASLVFLKNYFNANLTFEVFDSKPILVAKKEEYYIKECKRGKKEWVAHLVDRKLNSYEIKMSSSRAKIESCNHTFFRDDNTSRLYTTITMMPKLVRDHLLYNGERLVESDIDNCMPYLALALFSVEPYVTLDIEAAIKKHNTVLFTEPYDVESKELFQRLKDYHEGSLQPDIELYRELVSTGGLYDFLEKKYPHIAPNRAEFKEQFFYGLFDKVNSKSKLYKALKEDFPNVMRVFDLIKTGFNKTNKEGRTRDEQGNALCMLLYHIESHMMIDRVAKRFNNEFPKAPIFTVHDALLTTPGNVDALNRILMEEFTEVFGIPPTIG